MKKVNIFKREVSVYDGIKDTKDGCEATLSEVLKNHGYEDEVGKYRRTKRKEDKLALPLFTCSGVFSKRTNDGLIKHNGVICIDIDKKDNTDVENFDEIPSLIGRIPYVAYCAHSCGGEGYFVLMPIEDTDKHLLHYESACDDFERCGISVDRSCKNVSRTRFISYDNEAYFNYEAVVYTRVKAEVVYSTKSKKVVPAAKSIDTSYNTRTEVVKSYTKVKGFDRTRFKAGVFKPNPVMEQIEFDEIKNRVELTIMLIERDGIDITATYDDWYKVGAALANQFGEDGRKYFHRVSCFYPKYSKVRTAAKYHQFKGLNDITIGTFFYIAKKYGVDIF